MAFATVSAKTQSIFSNSVQIFSSLSTSPSIRQGQTFFREGRWWSIEHHAAGPEGGYYYCRPVVLTEVKMFHAQEVIEAMSCDDDNRGSGRLSAVRTVAASQDDRGSGRRLALVHSGHPLPRSTTRAAVAPLKPKRDSFKLLALGSRRTINDNIRELHLLGYAETDSWSRVMPAPKRGEFMSILIRNTPRLGVN